MTREAIFCFDTATVRFAIYPDGDDGARVIAQISEDPLRDLFGASGDGATLLAAYDRHADRINEMAIARYRANSQQPIVLQTMDFDAVGIRGGVMGVVIPQVIAAAPRARASVGMGWRTALAA
ncbi:DUF1488 family protein [Variovorax ginsengisoli]|uniref:DUF1488 domain-containing protein n=1 Tax=Variovorax ginsengisoli TaxID=363844 RepID=A0ABT9S764_9BURK|nr:DUF1488 family protein [Variovorax ginsengisoli]MDP9900050.1 hypothetical protein [Variovorax ginsengisoli]